MVASTAPNSAPATKRAQIGAGHLRTDKWWLEPGVTAVVLAAFVVYSTIRAFANQDYYAAPLLSPLYSPCLATNCVPGASDFGTPIGAWWILSPALLILIFPLGFRMSCYYYRKAYYRAFWLSPPACAVPDAHSKYTGETRFPLILQNLHRYFFYFALVFNVILTYDAVIAFRNADHEWGHMSVGTIVLLINAGMLWMYSMSCHSCRNAVGGRLKHFSKHPLRYKAWTWVSRQNPHHPRYAWLSLFAVALTDVYIMLVANGTITNYYLF